MATATSQFPGMEEVIQDLLDEKKKTPKAQRLPSPARAADISKNAVGSGLNKIPKGSPGPLSVGRFAGTLGKAGGAVGRAAGPVGMAASTLAALGPVAYNVGETVGDAYYNTTMKEEYDKADKEKAARKDFLSASQKRVRQGNPTVADVTGDKSGGAQEMTFIPGIESAMASSSKKEAPTGGDENTPRIPSSTAVKALAGQSGQNRKDKRAARRARRTPEDQALSTVEGDTPMTEDSELESLTALENSEMMNTPAQEYRAPRVTVDQEAEARVKELGQNRTQRKTPKETFGRKIKRFVTAGSGPIDFTRLDRQEEEAFKAQNEMTGRERFGALTSAQKVQRAEDANRQSDLLDHGSEGIAPSTNKENDFQRQLQRELGIQERGESAQSARDLTQHGYDLEKLEKSAAMLRLSPENRTQEAKLKFLQDNPTSNPAEIEKILGFPLDKSFVDAYNKGMSKSNSMSDIIVGALLSRMGGTAGENQPVRPKANLGKYGGQQPVN